MTTAVGKARSKPESQTSPLTVSAIVSAARQLNDDQWLRLLTALDRIEDQRFEKERERISESLQATGITEEDIDAEIMRRRREGRG